MYTYFAFWNGDRTTLNTIWSATSSGSENVTLVTKSKRTKDEIVKIDPLGSSTSNASGNSRLIRKVKLQTSRRESGTGIDNMRRVSSYNRPWAQKVMA